MRGAPPPLVGLPATPTADLDWILVEEGFAVPREHELESLFAIGNGNVGSRGSLAEGSAFSAPATFAAGVFDVGPNPAEQQLLRLADWAHVSVSVEGHRLRLDRGHYLAHRRILDLRQGMLFREWQHRDEGGRVTGLRELRLASLADRHLLIQSMTITPKNYSGRISIDVTPSAPLNQVTDSGISVIMAIAIRLVDPRGRSRNVADRLSLEIGPRETCRLERVVAVHTSRDPGEPVAAARRHAEGAIADVPGHIARHRDAWLQRWKASDLRIEGDAAAQRAVRFAIYHLTSAANPDDDRVSIGARALSGPAYKGHVFWDTDVFMLPFFVLTYPEAARAHIMYRYHTLAAARAKATRFRYRGALYAWESTNSGEEAAPPFVMTPDGEAIRILTGEQEQHISADIAFGVWKYWKATGDERFLVDAGAEILIETARFWASRVAREDDGRYHIRRVIGPDEYHETVDDNAYTNGMAQWNLEAAAAIARRLLERWPAQWRALSRRLGLEAQEPHQWVRVARDLYTGFDEQSGLFEQFQGYFALEDVDLAAFAQRSVPMDVLLGRERTQQSKIIKQADVVMLIYLLWERFSPDVRKVNFEYYEPRCGHGSSLSPAIHALVAARLGKTELAQRYFRQAAAIDLADNMGNAATGIHAGAMGGLWQASVFGFAGLQLAAARPQYHPKLPPNWRSLSMQFHWRGQWHDVTLPERGGNARQHEDGA